jgi:hypothetical protein
MRYRSSYIFLIPSRLSVFNSLILISFSILKLMVTLGSSSIRMFSINQLKSVPRVLPQLLQNQ